MEETYLIINTGSSTTKYALYNRASHTLVAVTSINNAIAQAPLINTVGIRIVAPGTFFTEHRIIDQEYIDKLVAIQDVASIHVTLVLKEMASIRKLLPEVTLVGVSDSVFHTTMPLRARLYGIPLDDAKRLDIYRFGYHGISCQSIVRSMQEHNTLAKRMIICHLGGGTSITAVLDGISIDTSMGFSPLEGAIMATRSGSIDPTAVTHLAKHLPTGIDSNTYLNYHCGLLGVSGLSGDMQELLQAQEAGNERARLALELYVYSIVKAIGAACAALGGLDALVFTGGIGEHIALIRDKITSQLVWLGIQQDAIRVIPTDEMREIAVTLVNTRQKQKS